MKANELMVGDWVKFPIGNEKVVDLPYIEGRGICASFAASATLFPVEVDKLEPIPLTAEILEKNGFKKQGFDGWEIDHKTDDGNDLEWLALWRNDYSSPHLQINSFVSLYGSFSSFGIHFVHQLQHALKLCQIDKEITV